MIEKLVSGGQTGADLAALDLALRQGVSHGGWCPQGRFNENGPIPDHYQLTETPEARVSQRTEWNVRDSDGTVVFTIADVPTGGSCLTVELAKQMGKPCLHLHPATPNPVDALRAFLRKNKIRTLNVAGSRASGEPDIYKWVTEMLEAALSPTM